MKASEVLGILKDAVSTAQEAGVAHVAIEDLKTFAADLGRTSAESPEGVSAGDASMEVYKAKLVALGNSLQQEHASNLEMLRATITTGQSALKSALLINGGAAAATLAFIGSVWSSTKTPALLPSLAYGLSLFVWGVLSAACAAGATYLSQAGYGGELGSRSQSIGGIARALAIVGVVGAYGLFGYAAWQTYVAVSG